MATGKTNTHNHRWLSLLVIFKYINIMCIYTYTYIYIHACVKRFNLGLLNLHYIHTSKISKCGHFRPSGPGFTMAPRLEGLRETSAEGSTMTRCNPVICTSPHHFSVGFQTSLHDRFRYPLVNIQKTIENLHFE
jgi:hypothetical protein